MNPFSALTCLANKLFYRPTRPTFKGASTALAGTSVVPVLEIPFAPGQSAIWCCSLELGWQKFQQSYGGGPIRVADGQDLADLLNRSTASPDDFPAGWLAFEEGELPPEWRPAEGRLIFCRLRALLTFDLPFLDCRLPLKFRGDGGDREVKSFGIPPGARDRYSGLRKQVQILFDRSGEHGREFALDLCVTSQPFRLILAVVPRPSTLAEAYEYVRTTAGDSRPLGHRDVLLVPNMNWDLAHQFMEVGGPVLHPPGEDLKVCQQVQFRLDRSGCQLVSVNLLFFIGILGGAKEYIFDRPFLLVLENRRTGRPVFVMWVANAELLESG